MLRERITGFYYFPDHCIDGVEFIRVSQQRVGYVGLCVLAFYLHGSVIFTFHSFFFLTHLLGVET